MNLTHAERFVCMLSSGGDDGKISEGQAFTVASLFSDNGNSVFRFDARAAFARCHECRRNKPVRPVAIWHFCSKRLWDESETGVAIWK